MAKPNDAQGKKHGYKDDYNGFYAPTPVRSEVVEGPIYVYVVQSPRYSTHVYRKETDARRYADGVLQPIITKVELR